MAKFTSCKTIPITIMKHLLNVHCICIVARVLDEMGINSKAGTPLAKTLMAMKL